MTTRVKEILKEAIHIYNAIPIDGKVLLIDRVKSNLSMHYNGVKTIGIGLDIDKVQAGEIFLRIFNK